MSGGNSGPSAAQVQAQERSLEIAEGQEERELARERSLKLRTLARMRARRVGNSGRRTLMFNPGRMDLGVTPNAGPNPNSPASPATSTTRRLPRGTPGATFGRRAPAGFNVGA